MKRIFTLSLVMLLTCMCAMAQVVLGDIKFSLGEGKKISPTTGKILVTFPDVTGADESTAFTIEGSFGIEGTEFDGVEGTFASGVIFDLAEYELQPSTEYALTITSVKVGGAECAAEGGYVLHFLTRGAERKMSWTFTIDEASSAQIVAEATANPAVDGADETKYMDITKNDATTKRYYVPARNYEEILLPDGTVLPMTEDLSFKFGNKAFYVGKYNDGDYKDLISFNGKNQYMVIPDCKVGDVITFNANRATKGSETKPTCIQAMNAAAIATDGIVSSSGVADSIWLGSSYANYKFEAQVDGDITFRFSNCLLKTINIEEGMPKVARNYNVIAQYSDDTKTVDLKELVAKKEGTTGSNVKVNYPYWLVDAEGNAYTHGSKGNPFEEVFDLKNNGGENEDTTFVVKYKKTDFTGVVYLSEGEDLENAVLCTHANAAIRSSMGKAGYVAEDLKLVTLQPGTYKIRGVIFDANGTASHQVVLTKGEGEENELYLTANATNWTEAETDLITIETPTDITLKAGGSDNKGLDVIMIYASTDAPDDPDGIVSVKSADEKVAARKVAKNGQIVIETPAGTFNAVGAQVK
ncbi:MAG: hypothetical protein IJ914_02985 [Prevotella sp.]|nr:hypothetical protein [Prevotella sp.]